MNEGAKPFEVRLFGGIEAHTPYGVVSGRDFGGVKQRHILALLALHETLSKDHLAELLWEGSPPAEYVATLESYVSLLRRRLDPTSPGRQSVVVTRNGGYGLNPDRVSTDVGRFDQLLAASARLPAHEALPALTAAVELTTATLLADEPYPIWAVDARQRHRVRLVDAATQAAEYAMDLGRIGSAQALASRATDLDQLAERAWRVRMRAYLASDDNGAAVRCFDTLRRCLADELGVVPGPATQALFVEILHANQFVEILHANQVEGSELDSLVAAILAAAREIAVQEEPTGSGPGRVVQLLTHAHTLVQTIRGRQMLTLSPTG